MVYFKTMIEKLLLLIIFIILVLVEVFELFTNSTCPYYPNGHGKYEDIDECMGAKDGLSGCRKCCSCKKYYLDCVHKCMLY